MQATLNQDTVKRFINIVEENFSNGIRDDFIDTSKILRIFSVYYPDENIFRDSLIEMIHSTGIENSGRFYFVSDDNIENILFLFDEILKKSPIAYYSSVYKKHFDFFARLHIFSSDILKKILHLYDTRHFHFNDFCSKIKSSCLENELTKIFNKLGNPLRIEDLQKKLPYVPAEKIIAALSDTKYFFMSSKRFFFLISKIHFDSEEIESAQKKISIYINSDGSADLDDCDFSSTFAQNLELSEKDLQNVIYRKFFSSDFIKRGTRLFKKGESSKKNKSNSLFDDLRNFIAVQNELSVKKLFSVAKNLGLDTNRALRIANEKMIRVDENFFVKDSLINFDISEIDNALSSFVQNKIIPLRAVTSFTAFPPIQGYSWNLFLLESFLRKFSQKFIFNSTGANNSNTGSIYPKSMKFADYLEVQVAAVIQEKIPLQKWDVENFLLSQGYRSMRFDSVTSKIIKRAQEIYNR